MRNALRAALLAIGSLAMPAGAMAQARFEPLVYHLPGSHCPRMTLMNLPPAWRTGDAAVLLLTTAPLQDPLRDPLVAALLRAGAAVVEAVAGPLPRCDDMAGSAEAPQDDPLAVLFALLLAARRAGAGLTVALGHGPGGTVALEAAEEATAARHLGDATPRFAAAAALGGDRAAFAAGAAMPEAEAAPLRLGLFCDALADVLGGAAACRGALAAARAGAR